MEKIYQGLSSLPTQARTVTCDRGAFNNVKNHLSKARNIFRMLNNFWRSSVPHKDKAEGVPELCTFYPVIWPKVF